MKSNTYSAHRFCHFLHWAVLVFRARALPLPPPAFTCTKVSRTKKWAEALHGKKLYFLYWVSLGGVPLRPAAGFWDPVSESESQMDLSGFLAFGAGVFLGLGAASVGFLTAAHCKHLISHYISPSLITAPHSTVNHVISCFDEFNPQYT